MVVEQKEGHVWRGSQFWDRNKRQRIRNRWWSFNFLSSGELTSFKFNCFSCKWMFIHTSHYHLSYRIASLLHDSNAHHFLLILLSSLSVPTETPRNLNETTITITRVFVFPYFSYYYLMIVFVFLWIYLMLLLEFFATSDFTNRITLLLVGA